MLPLTTITGVQPKNGVDNAAPTIIAANTVTTGPAVGSDFGFFLLNSLLLRDSCRATLPVAVSTATPLRHRLVVAYGFADFERDIRDPGQQSEVQDTSHSLFLSVCVT
jgi:hypothetical protein